MKKEAAQDISIKNTKEQILLAYNQVVGKLTDKQLESPQEKKKKDEDIALVVKAVKNTPESILNELGDLKYRTIKQVDVLSEQLIAEFSKLSDIREAVVLEQKHLEDLYQIKDTANTLAALIKTNEIEKENFDQLMQQQKAALDQEISLKQTEWQSKQEQLEKGYNERKELLEKNRKREEEEYKYNLELLRRKETDEYNNKKVIQEKELAEMTADISKREADLISKESLFTDLEAKVVAFPNELIKSIVQAENKLKAELEQKFKYTSELREKENEANCKLYEQKVSYLESRITEQDQIVKELTQKAHDATKQVEAIACRALDTSTQRIIYNTTDDKNRT